MEAGTRVFPFLTSRVLHAIGMENSPLSNQVDIRLKQLDRQIHNSLKVIRQHLHELEQVEQHTRTGATPDSGQSFADLLDNAVGDTDRPDGS